VTRRALLADTNILSYAHNEHTLWEAYRPLLEGYAVLIAAQTLAELRYGAFLSGWGLQRTKRLEALIAQHPVVYPNDAVCSRWARIRAEAGRIGHQLGPSDAWIAATALELGVPLVTHNAKDFRLIEGLDLMTKNTA
jgi:tRNA(fMet)-specific endonuclease VapC